MPNQAWPLKELNKKKEPTGCAIPMAFLLGSHQLVADLRLARKFGMIGGRAGVEGNWIGSSLGLLITIEIWTENMFFITLTIFGRFSWSQLGLFCYLG